MRNWGVWARGSGTAASTVRKKAPALMRDIAPRDMVLSRRWHKHHSGLAHRSAQREGGLLPTPRNLALSWPLVGACRRIDHAHRGFAALLLERVRRQSGDARDDQQRIGDFGRQPHVSTNGGNGAVDVDREWPALERNMLGERVLDGPEQLCVRVIDL